MGDPEFPTIRLAAAQAAPPYLDRSAAVRKACQMIAEAGAGGADVVAFAEGFIPGHPVWFYHHPALSPESLGYAERLFRNAIEIPGPDVDALCAAAAAARIHVVIGVCQRRPGSAGTLWNSQLFIGPSGEVIGVHQKLVPTAAERLVHTGGAADGMRAFDTEFGRIGGLICGENSNPLAINALIRDQIRVHVASWPNYFAPGWPPGMAETGLMTGRSIAYMAKCFVINACGTIHPEASDRLATSDRDRQYLADPANLGGSTIIDPTGAVIAGPAGPGEQIIYADADLGQIVRTKLIHDLAGHYQRDDDFEFAVLDRTAHRSRRPATAPAEPETGRRPRVEPSEEVGHTDGSRAPDGRPDRPALPSHPGAGGVASLPADAVRDRGRP
jgi:aliphatic nitrilase